MNMAKGNDDISMPEVDPIIPDLPIGDTNNLKAECVSGGWTVGIKMTNTTGKNLYKYGVKFHLPEGCKINEAGGFWGDDTWDAYIEVYELEGNEYILVFDYNNASMESSYLGDTKSKTHYFGVLNLEANAKDVIISETWYDGSSKFLITLIAPAAHEGIDVSEVSAQKVSIEGGQVLEREIEIGFGETREIVPLEEGQYRVSIQNIETDEYLYIPVNSSYDFYLSSISPTEEIKWTLPSKHEKANVKFLVLGDVSKFEGIDSAFTVTVTPKEGENFPIEKNISFEIKTSEITNATEIEISLLKGYYYNIDCSIIFIDNTAYALQYIESQESQGLQDNNSFYLNGEMEISLTILSTSIRSDNTILKISSEGIPIDFSAKNINILLKRLYDNGDQHKDIDVFYSIDSAQASEGSEVVFSDFIRYGTYSISVDNMECGSDFYAGKTDHSITFSEIDKEQYLHIIFQKFTIPYVKGWPNYLAHGGITFNQTGLENQYKELGCTIDSLFKYAGINGGGDRGVVLYPGNTWVGTEAALATHGTIAQSRNLAALQGSSVMPVMVIYTADLSSGISDADFESENLKYHYMNLLTECCVAQSYKNKEGEYPYPATFIINPDFLGMIQQNKGISPIIQGWFEEGSIEVNICLKDALNNHKYLDMLQSDYGYQIPQVQDIPDFKSDIKGYINSINWMIKTLAPDVPFGWQINVWGDVGAQWVHSETDQSKEKAASVITFLSEMGVYSSSWMPDFIVFDKYERDDFGSTAITNSYAWNMTSWQRYLNFTKCISDGVHKPSMLWQIPGCHMVTVEEGLNGGAIVNDQHAGSGGTFFMGDPIIGFEPDQKVQGSLLNISLANSTYYLGASTIKELLAKDGQYDYKQSQLRNALLSNAFAILWGGGQTTSVVSIYPTASTLNDTWLAEKLKEYYKNPLLTTGEMYKSRKKVYAKNQSRFKEISISK